VGLTPHQFIPGLTRSSSRAGVARPPPPPPQPSGARPERFPLPWFRDTVLRWTPARTSPLPPRSPNGYAPRPVLRWGLLLLPASAGRFCNNFPAFALRGVPHLVTFLTAYAFAKHRRTRFLDGRAPKTAAPATVSPPPDHRPFLWLSNIPFLWAPATTLPALHGRAFPTHPHARW